MVGMTSDRSIETVDVLEHIFPGAVLPAARSFGVFSDEKKLSIAALSQTLPDRLYAQPGPPMRTWVADIRNRKLPARGRGRRQSPAMIGISRPASVLRTTRAG